MKKNMGKTDKLIRLFVAIAVAVFVFFNSKYNFVGDVVSYVLLGVAGIFVLTSFISFCPLYTLIGVNTCSVDEQKKD